MKIEFYEEFTTKENLEKLKLIKFKTRLFVASKSIEEFKKLEEQANKINKKLEIAYWPIIKNSYWISPFSNKGDLIELFSNLEKISNHLLIDLELPLKSKWKIYFKNIFYFRKNKRIIRKFLKENKKRITTAEYPSAFASNFMKLIGLNYNIKTEKSIMWYSSMLSESLNKKIKNNIQNIKDKNNYSISLGTIATGILGNEPILSPENLKRDLEFANRCGFKKVIIFRLGGLNKKYMNIIEKFI